MSTTRSRGAHGLRISVATAMLHASALQDALYSIERRSQELGATDQLAETVRALRSIANYSKVDTRSKGIALGALKRIGVKP